MFDVNFLPHQTDKIRIFGPNSATAGASWHLYEVPRNTSMLSVFMCGGGAGGGGGPSAAAGNPRGGGGGGGSAGWGRMIVPAALLPSQLFGSDRLGGAGGAEARNGSAGVQS